MPWQPEHIEILFFARWGSPLTSPCACAVAASARSVAARIVLILVAPRRIEGMVPAEKRRDSTRQASGRSKLPLRGEAFPHALRDRDGDAPLRRRPPNPSPPA